jgi:methionyl-tRNA formyltransferase
MKIVFFGTSDFSARVLTYLLEHHYNVCAVVTRQDKPRGRAQQLLPSPVKSKAQKLASSLPIYTPEKASTDAFAAILKGFRPDLFVVVAYGEIIKQNLLDIPKLDPINIHASLLPKYRGAAPMQRALMAGEKETGVTLIEMILKMDAGPILDMQRCSVSEEMTLGELDNTLFELACLSLKKVLHQYAEGTVQKIAQDESQATFAQKIMPEELHIDWNRSASQIHNLIRAVSPKPAAWANIIIGQEEKRLKIKLSKVLPELSGSPGSLIERGKGQCVIACGQGALELLEIQLEGKKTMAPCDFLCGLQETFSFPVEK